MILWMRGSACQQKKNQIKPLQEPLVPMILLGWKQPHSVERALDETRDNITRTIEEARRDIPRNTQAINDCQEQYLRSVNEITDEFLNCQKEIVKSFQSTLAPYIENGYHEIWNKWGSPQKAAEIYARTV